ncbi:hypothetical protein VIGAN_04105300, partial [Vigna angularis var. angularis]
MKAQANKHRKERSFEIGDMVFLKLKPHRQNSVISRISPKLSARYYGPFEVIERIGEVAYRLQLPPNSKIHPVFHVSLIKKAIGEYKTAEGLPTGLEEDQSEVWLPQKVLATRSILKGGERVNQWLVHWLGKTAEEATWEDEMSMKVQFPTFSLEDKTIFQEGGIDTAQIPVGPHNIVDKETKEQKRWGQVYSRRKQNKEAEVDKI